MQSQAKVGKFPYFFKVAPILEMLVLKIHFQLSLGLIALSNCHLYFNNCHLYFRCLFRTSYWPLPNTSPRNCLTLIVKFWRIYVQIASNSSVYCQPICSCLLLRSQLAAEGGSAESQVHSCSCNKIATCLNSKRKRRGWPCFSFFLSNLLRKESNAFMISVLGREGEREFFSVLQIDQSGLKL